MYDSAGGRFELAETLKWLDFPALKHLDFGCVSCQDWTNNALPSDETTWLSTWGPAQHMTYLDFSTPPTLTNQQMLHILRWTGLEHLNISRQRFPEPRKWPTRDGMSCCHPVYKGTLRSCVCLCHVMRHDWGGAELPTQKGDAGPVPCC
jgi:hypothetical protein